MKNIPIPDDSPANRATSGNSPLPATAVLKRWLSHATEPHILFPVIAVLGLAAIWGVTLHLIKVERTAAEHAAMTSSRELAETYESQVMRALREIDQALKFVKYAYELRGKKAILQELKAKSLLPSDLVFEVSITDGKGNIMASTHQSEMRNVAGQEFFKFQPPVDDIMVSRPWKSPASEEWRLLFSRRISDSDGKFAGVVMITVDAAYFVSVYDPAKLGAHGVLGILGNDGIFRARRSGEKISAGDFADFSAVIPATDEAQSQARLTTNPWDGVPRYTSALTLYDFPLAVVVGLSSEEQLAVSRKDMHAYVWLASACSLLLILIVTVLGRMSWQLAQSRSRAAEEQIAHAERIEYLAYHDGLTMLPNRSLFSKLLNQSINQARRYNHRLAVLFLDLDRFKRINDTLGHEAGDQLLQEVSTRLKDCLRDSDTVARLGGDEFIVLLPEISEEKYVATVAQQLVSAVSTPFVLLGQQFRVTASIGISIYPQDGLDEQTLTKNADIAMYQAKGEGKNNFQFYSKQLNTNSVERTILETGLRHALERNEFQLHYQAKRDLRSGRITGMEALLRWKHPNLGSISPMQFIPIAEESGLIIPIGKWVIKAACMQNMAWQGQGMPHISMAVNLTARQFFDEHLLADLTAILAETGMDAHRLELTINESLLMRDVAKALRILATLKDKGIRIAIDGFGIGYFSLATLKQFPLDTIKIDRSFIRDISSVAEDKELTKAIIAMGQKLSLTVVAQGVETKEQADFLRQNACDEIQGFYLNKPLPADQMSELLRTQTDITVSDTNPAA
jgi:diguanylate cyclase (GGDEF)-like protein